MGSSATVAPFKLAIEYNQVGLFQQIVKIEEYFKDLKLAVVGILGENNTGKSFLMNLMSEYLQCEEIESHRWMEDLIANKKPISGFEMNSNWPENIYVSKYRIEAGGLYMWPRPFILKKPGDGNTEEKIAVILLDINMKQATPSMQLLMCLLCSTVIYNTTSTDISHLIRLITTVRKSVTGFGPYGNAIKSKELLFQHLTVIFRDHAATEVKCGEDKSLKYLKGKNPQFSEEINTIPTIDCFLLPKPKEGPMSKEGCFEADKNFTQHIKLLISKTLTVDNLAMKTWNESCIDVKTFYSIGRNICSLVISPLLKEFNRSLPCLETNLDEPMDTLETTTVVVNEHEEIILPEDVEMKDLSSNQNAIVSNGAGSHPGPCVPTQDLVSENHFEKADTHTHTYFHNDVKINKNCHTDKNLQEEIERQVVQFENNTEKRVRDAMQDIPKPIRLLNKSENTIKETIADEISQKKTQAAVTEKATAKNWKDEKTDVNKNEDAVPVKVIPPINKLNFEEQSQLETRIKMYNKSVEEFLSSNFPLSTENLLKNHNRMVESFKEEISNACKENNDHTSQEKLLNALIPQLEKAYEYHQQKVQHDCAYYQHAENALTHFEKCFSKEYKNGLKSGSFFKSTVEEIVKDLMEKSTREYFTSTSVTSAVISKPYLLTTMYKLPGIQKCRVKIQILQKALKQYLIEMNKKLNMYNFFSDEQLDKFHANASNKSSELYQDRDNMKIFDLGISTLKEQYEKINKDILPQEKNAFKNTIIPKVKNFYDIEMKRVTQKKMTSAQLTAAHEKLKQECKEVVRKACSFQDSNIPLLKTCFQQLDQALNYGFENYIQANQIKVDKLQAKIQAAIRKVQVEYNEVMVKKIGNKLFSAVDLANLHKECFNGVAGVLKLEIRSIDDSEDINLHIKSLDCKTQKDLNSYTEENNNRIKNEEERKISERLEAKKLEAAEKIKQRNKTLQPESPSVTSSTWNDDNDKKHSKTPQQQCEENPSPIIAIELGPKKIKTGMIINGKYEPIPNQWGYAQFPNKVATTHAGEILVGDEYFERRDVQDVYHMDELMGLPMNELQSSPLSPIELNGHTFSPKKEFLTGLILSRIKTDAENFLQQNVTSAVITVPLSYTSSQRQATKDSAIIAGFTAVHLINDITAAALAYANHDSRLNSGNDFLIVNAVDDNIDVAVYSYLKGTVKMEMCTGNLHGYPNDGSFSVFKKFKKMWSSFMNKDTMDAVKNVIHNCVYKTHCITQTAVIFEGSNSGYRDRLHDIVSQYGRYAEEPKSDDAIILGASHFANLLNSKEYLAKSAIRDLLPYSVEFERFRLKNGKLLERHLPLSPKERNQAITIESNGTLALPILEYGNLSLNPVKTGTLYVNIQAKWSTKRSCYITAYINSEGILRFTAHYMDYKEDIEVDWNSYNLSNEEIAKYASMVNFCNPNPQHQRDKNLLEDSKKELRTLAEHLLHHCDKVESVFGKDQIERRAKSSIEVANHPKSTQEDINNRIAVLTKLKSKYLAEV